MKKAKDYNSWKEIEQENNVFLKIVKKFIATNYGRRCSALGQGCGVCEMWCIYDLLRTHLMNRP